mmetsp:Transcript_28243/g.50469  ORF Transcript_28243/g.50469 Transcript_28243/m.50469 type:complete len:202 (-) Transcript_28243:91-696(-)|eukprot:CAMPEP_0168608930 /NCGR_PEP_ID=MMETSP0449_2-20121227/915_1 /TAXON_ID=1082188 /ORGANISM="Strombidium rassoulzadegani, Strain ras09" /LENGTH=201 /DNA_ID=CAMNT_0008648999 /DNA_START=67 /DNA_END=672 /DNA_ORIENTATION=-
MISTACTPAGLVNRGFIALTGPNATAVPLALIRRPSGHSPATSASPNTRRPALHSGPCFIPRGLLDDLRHSFSASFSSVDEVPVNVVCSVTDETYQELINRAPGRLVVVDFYAEWCKPCKKLAPLLTKMAVMHPYVVIATYKCDKTRPTLPKSLGVTSFPTFLLYRDGERIGMLKGANSAGELMQIVANHDKQAAANESAL